MDISIDMWLRGDIHATTHAAAGGGARAARLDRRRREPPAGGHAAGDEAGQRPGCRPGRSRSPCAASAGSSTPSRPAAWWWPSRCRLARRWPGPSTSPSATSARRFSGCWTRSAQAARPPARAARRPPDGSLKAVEPSARARWLRWRQPAVSPPADTGPGDLPSTAAPGMRVSREEGNGRLTPRPGRDAIQHTPARTPPDKRAYKSADHMQLAYGRLQNPRRLEPVGIQHFGGEPLVQGGEPVRDRVVEPVVRVDDVEVVARASRSTGSATASPVTRLTRVELDVVDERHERRELRVGDHAVAGWT